MRSAVGRYLAVRYLLHYAGVLALCGLIASAGLESAGLSAWLLPAVSLVASLALCTFIADLCSRREIEVLQSYGIGVSGVCAALTAAVFGPQILLAVLVVAASGNPLHVLLVTGVSLLSGTTAFTVMFVRLWHEREPGALRACTAGCTAQLVLLALLAALPK